MTLAFWRKNQRSIRSTGDLGLFLVHLSQGEADLALIDEVLRRVSTEAAQMKRANLQELSWVLWGTSLLAQRYEGAERTARATIASISRDYAAEAGLARHTTRRYRRNLVSFGSSVYYLRGLYEYGTAFGDDVALNRFALGVRKLIAAQGPLGEWPWMFDVRTAQPTDFYPVFAVHQDGMAMLFLFPALEIGIDGIQPAIDRSLSWAFGANELGIPMYQNDPFVAHRSIERDERYSRLRRYVRSVARSPKMTPATTGASRLRLNPECRSYHLGWMLFAWSGSQQRPLDGKRPDAMQQMGAR